MLTRKDLHDFLQEAGTILRDSPMAAVATCRFDHRVSAVLARAARLYGDPADAIAWLLLGVGAIQENRIDIAAMADWPRQDVDALVRIANDPESAQELSESMFARYLRELAIAGPNQDDLAVTVGCTELLWLWLGAELAMLVSRSPTEAGQSDQIWPVGPSGALTRVLAALDRLVGNS